MFDSSQLTNKRFCVQPHIGGAESGAVFKTVPEQCTQSHLRLEQVEGISPSKRFRLGIHLIEKYQSAGLPDSQARYDGTLILNRACQVTADGFIEPTGEVRIA